jgi:hypothetical protein
MDERLGITAVAVKHPGGYCHVAILLGNQAARSPAADRKSMPWTPQVSDILCRIK